MLLKKNRARGKCKIIVKTIKTESQVELAKILIIQLFSTLRAINFFNVITQQARAHLKFKAATSWTRGKQPRKRKSHPKREGRRREKKEARASNGAKINNRGLIGVKRRKLVGAEGTRKPPVYTLPPSFFVPGTFIVFFSLTSPRPQEEDLGRSYLAGSGEF